MTRRVGLALAALGIVAATFVITQYPTLATTLTAWITIIHEMPTP